MPSTSTIEFVAELRGEPRVAAERLTRSLVASPGPGFTTPRITGEIRFPQVELWRARGLGMRSPLARFTGAIEPMGNGAVLVGRVSVPESASQFVMLIAASCVVFFVTVMVATFAAGLIPFLTVSGLFGGLLWIYLYLTRRAVKAGTAAEAQLLIEEIRELVTESSQLDS